FDKGDGFGRLYRAGGQRDIGTALRRWQQDLVFGDALVQPAGVAHGLGNGAAAAKTGFQRQPDVIVTQAQQVGRGRVVVGEAAIVGNGKDGRVEKVETTEGGMGHD